MTNQKSLKILTLHGPNLNMLGWREKGIYGHSNLEQINVMLTNLASELGAQLSVFQSNHEGELIDWIQKASSDFAGILINPAAYGHSSVALRDALLAAALPFVEVHMSNIHTRESFRQKTLLSDIAAGVVIGFGPASYTLGLRGLVQKIREGASS